MTGHHELCKCAVCRTEAILDHPSKLVRGRVSFKSPDSEIWQKALKLGEKDVLVYDRAAVRKALRESREHRGVKVPVTIKSILP